MTDEEQTQRLVDQYLAAYTAHDAAGCAALYDEAGVILSPWEPPVHGPERIARTHETWFAEGETDKTMEISDLVVSGDIAVCLLHFAANMPDGSKAEGTSLNSLKRQPDGGWKLLHTSLNMLDAATSGGG
jgi:uncharacterized protein (TIGR02246 family)